MINFGSSAPGATGASFGSGLIQGMQARQGMDMNKQTMEANDFKMDELKKQVEAQRVSTVKQNLNEALYDSNLTGNYKNVNKLLGQNTDLTGGGSFRPVGVADLYDGEGKLSNQFLNKYRSDTGRQIDEEGASALIGKGQMFTDAEGNERFFNNDSFAAGSSNYASYSKDRSLKEKLIQAKIAKELGAGADGEPIKGINLLNQTNQQIAALEDANMPVPESLLKTQSILDEKFQTNKPEAIDRLSTNPFEAPMNDLIEKNIPMDTKTRNDIRRTQNRSGFSLPKKDEMTKELTGYGTMMDTKKRVNQILDSKDARATGMIENAQVEAAKHKKDWGNMDKDTKQTALNTVFGDSALGIAVAQYLQSISGAAVAEEEYDRIMKALTGGGKANAETLKAAMEGATQTMGSSIVGKIKQIGANYPNDKAEMWEGYQNILNRKVDLEGLPIAEDTGGADSLETTATLAGEEVAGDIWSQVTYTLTGGDKFEKNDDGSVKRDSDGKAVQVKDKSFYDKAMDSTRSFFGVGDKSPAPFIADNKAMEEKFNKLSPRDFANLDFSTLSKDEQAYYTKIAKRRFGAK